MNRELNSQEIKEILKLLVNIVGHIRTTKYQDIIDRDYDRINDILNGKG